ncbi:MAG: BlaI/MecI/CopY family transcriptional regulator [Pirellulaceae bacterium]|nr:BlaI/MecI/CopY family transcriptional regulator [Planctomycetales bacterium]
MARKNVPRLLASELEILEMLWREDGVTIVQAQRALSGKPGYTTVQTRLNRLVKKGIVKRSRTKPAKYAAAIKAEDVATSDLDLLLARVSQGRVLPLVRHLVKDRSLGEQEIAELKRLIAEAERQKTSEQCVDSEEKK